MVNTATSNALHAAFVTIIKMQDEMNTIVNPDWRNAGYPFCRAINAEVAEAIGHVSWEWWRTKGGPVLLPKGEKRLQLFLEMADILHFGISVMLLRGRARFNKDTPEPVSLAYETRADNLRAALDYSRGDNAYTGDQPGLAFIETLEDVQRQALDQAFSAEKFFSACAIIGMDVASVIAYYHGKNVLNRFRQKHGYKEGTYRKNWGTADKPQEDNVSLAELIEDYRHMYSPQDMLTRINSNNFQEYLKQNLSVRYTNLDTDY